MNNKQQLTLFGARYILHVITAGCKSSHLKGYVSHFQFNLCSLPPCCKYSLGFVISIIHGNKARRQTQSKQAAGRTWAKREARDCGRAGRRGRQEQTLLLNKASSFTAASRGAHSSFQHCQLFAIQPQSLPCGLVTWTCARVWLQLFNTSLVPKYSFAERHFFFPILINCWGQLFSVQFTDYCHSGTSQTMYRLACRTTLPHKADKNLILWIGLN